MSDKSKIAVTTLASLLLVAMVIGVTVSVSKRSDSGSSPAEASGSPTISSSTKAVKAICAPTDYKETCEQSLANTNSTNPKDLIKATFDATVKNITDALNNNELIQEAAKDPKTKEAFNVCQEVLETSIEDLRRSFSKVQEFDPTKIDDYVEDVKTWLSGAITYQETCIDAFENTTGETGEKMKKLLKTAGELSSNGLAMVTDFSKVLSSLNLGGLTANRKLLEAEFPSFVGSHERKLMAANALTPNAVVAQDGSGQFKTIGDAINKVPLKNNKTFVIYIKAGVYKEYVMIPKKVNNVVFIGDGPLKTRITGNKNYAAGVATFHTSTVVINGDNFMARDIGFENTAGAAGHQAVALRVSADKAIFHNVHIDSHQDSLYAHTYRQFYRDCKISGTIDFVFGDAQAVFQKCRFVVRKPMENQACMVTAQGRKDKRSVGAIVIQSSDIVAEPEFLAVKPALKAYLGRPWKEYSRTIIMQSNIDGFIAPEGWSPWMGTFALNTLYYGEYQNTGAGANTAQRVKWAGIKKITPQIADSFTPSKLYLGDDWIKASGVAYNPAMF